MKVSILLAIHLIAILIIQSVAYENMLGLKEYWLWEGFFLHLSLLSIFFLLLFHKTNINSLTPSPKNTTKFADLLAKLQKLCFHCDNHDQIIVMFMTISVLLGRHPHKKLHVS